MKCLAPAFCAVLIMRASADVRAPLASDQIGGTEASTDALPLAGLLDAPSTIIGNQVLSVKVYLPDGQRGFYRGVRFDWAGIIGSLNYQGHDFYVPWFKAVSPSISDYRYSNGQVINSANNATGPAEEFNADGGALGFEETPVGGGFLKIGVGLLRRPDDSAYDKFRRYPIIDPGKRSVATSVHTISFVQSIGSDDLHYAYEYTKTLRVDPKRPVMWIEHTLKNSGARPITTSVYNHNFLNIDDSGSTPGTVLETRFPLHSDRPIDAQVAEIRGHELVFHASPAMGQMIATDLTGYGTTVADNAFCFTDRDRRVGVFISGDTPLSHLMFWAIKPVVTVEPYVKFTVAPGQAVSWAYRYEFQAGSASCMALNKTSTYR